jgi:hypothetical protein
MLKGWRATDCLKEHYNAGCGEEEILGDMKEDGRSVCDVYHKYKHRKVYTSSIRFL